MNKFFGSIVLAAVVALSAGCCGDAEAATEAKLSSTTVVDAGFDKLTAAQQAQIVQSIADAQTKESEVIDTVDKWVNVGERIGKMVGGAAREVGVAANEFIQTDVGKMTAAMIIWNYMGADVVDVLVHVVGGSMFIVIGLTWIFIVMRRSSPTQVTYSTTEKNWFGNYVIVKKERDDLTSDQQIGFTLSAAVVLAVGLVSVLTAL